MRRRRGAGAIAGAALIAALALAALAVPAPAAAEQLSASELITLAELASDDPAAAERLRGVTAVDDRPVDGEAIFAGAEGDRLTERGRELARAIDPQASAEPLSPAAAELLEKRGAAEPVEDGEGRSFGGLGLDPLLTLLIALAVVALAALVAARVGARRLPVQERVAAGPGGPGAASSRSESEWEKLAAEAEAAGDFSAAVRYRYRAGLRGLDSEGLLVLRPSLTTGEVRRRVFSPRLHILLSDFEAIAYGGRDARSEDAEAARRDWPLAISEARAG